MHKLLPLLFSLASRFPAMALSVAETDALLRALMNPDNAIRQSAETAFGQLKQTPDRCVLSLLQVLRSPVPPEIRSMSALLLRRVIIKDDPSLWPQTTPETQEAFKTNVLESLGDSQLDPSTRKKVCDVVGELGVNIMDEDQWPQLLPFMFEKVNSGDPLQVCHHCFSLPSFPGLTHFFAFTFTARVRATRFWDDRKLPGGAHVSPFQHARPNHAALPC
jgi:hypothetical protein